MAKLYNTWFDATTRTTVEEFYNKYIDDKVLDERKIRDVYFASTQRFGWVMVVSFDLDNQCMYFTEYGLLKDVSKNDEQFLIYSSTRLDNSHIQHVLPVNFGGKVDDEALAWATNMRKLNQGAVARHCMCPYSYDLNNKIKSNMEEEFLYKNKRLQEELINGKSAIGRVMSKINKENLDI